MALKILTFFISVLLALNMGASGFSIAFTPSYASTNVNRKKAALLFSLFVVLGAVLVRPRIVETLTTRLIDQVLNPVSGAIILSSVAITMMGANLLKVPQSTSFVMVSAFAGAGFYFGNVNKKVLSISAKVIEDQ